MHMKDCSLTYIDRLEKKHYDLSVILFLEHVCVKIATQILV